MGRIYDKAPFTRTREMEEVASSLRAYEGIETARNIFEWVDKNTSYEPSRNENNRRSSHEYTYRSAHEVFERRMGICLDQSFLYTVLARYAGVESGIVKVIKDYHGDKVRHSCSYVMVSGDFILVDITYHRFDIGHKRYKIMSDSEVVEEYHLLKHSYEDGDNKEDYMEGILEQFHVNNFTKHFVYPVNYTQDYTRPVVNFSPVVCQRTVPSPVVHERPVVYTRKRGGNKELFYGLVYLVMGISGVFLMYYYR